MDEFAMPGVVRSQRQLSMRQLRRADLERPRHRERYEVDARALGRCLEADRGEDGMVDEHRNAAGLAEKGKFERPRTLRALRTACRCHQHEVLKGIVHLGMDKIL